MKRVMLCVMLSGVIQPVVAQDLTDAFRSYRAHIAAADSALRLGEGAGARRWLEAAPTEHRGWEWDLLSARADHSLRTLARHGSTIHDIAFSPDGARIAHASEDGFVFVRDANSGETVWSVQAHQGTAYRVNFSPDGTLLATSGRDKLARIYRADTGEHAIDFTGYATPVTGASFSPDGSRVASCNYRMEGSNVVGTIKVWDPATGGESLSADAGDKPMSMIRWSADGARLAGSSWNGTVYVIDAGTGATVHELAVPDEGVYTALNSVAWSGDARWIAAGSKDKTARVWDASTGELVATLAHDAWVTNAVFSPDGAVLATCSHDDNIRLWDTADWSLRATLRGHAKGPWTLAFSPDGSRLLSSGVDGAILEWDARAEHVDGVTMTDSDAPYATIWSPDDALLYTGTYDGRVHAWDSTTGKELRSWDAHNGESTNTIALSLDGLRLLSCSWDKTIKVWNPADGSLVRTIDFTQGVYDADISPDGRLAAGAPRERAVTIHNIDTGELLHRFDGLGGGASEVRFSPSGAMLAGAHGDKRVRVWRVDSGALAIELDTGAAANATAFTPDGSRLLAVTADGRVLAFSLPGGEKLWDTPVSSAGVYRVDVARDGRRAVAAGERCVLLDVASGAPVLPMRLHNDTTWYASFSRDGRRLASCSTDGTITIIDTRRRAVGAGERAAIALGSDMETRTNVQAGAGAEPRTMIADDGSLVSSVIVPAPREKVWEAWTTNEGLKGFFCQFPNVDLRIGGPFEILFSMEVPEGQRGSEGCKILSYKPGEMLSFSWNAPPKFTHARGHHVWVVLELEPVGAGATRVTLTHMGWNEKKAEFPDHAAEWDAVREYFTSAWPYVLGNLRRSFER